LLGPPVTGAGVAPPVGEVGVLPVNAPALEALGLLIKGGVVLVVGVPYPKAGVTLPSVLPAGSGDDVYPGGTAEEILPIVVPAASVRSPEFVFT
jgi:hypothetical protein